MKVSNRLVAGLGVLMVSASALVHAAPPDQRGDHDDNGPGQHQEQGAQGAQGGQQGNRGNDRGNDHRADNQGNDRRGGRPPQDFGDVRRTIQDHREVIGRGQPLPANIHVEKGRPLPRGYGRRLDDRSMQYLPRYDGYEWRRLGTDVVLVAIGSGIVYEILDGVLN
ncbi:anti-virulence regulator CigR family protein [Pseudomonas sp. LP_7_YM]|uniref:anti-virulence regulator CigR family protein n=1 Tax=Pseudomonas sp. LP_7_YM TaxID=2485137 RepID=UPI00105D8484|nr:anti-virulence regulator CigR family protein [Pseudomonas sp. LP_7_YM]TDV59881.1 nickel/cobalt transporter regulator [Pseudomonas sp. LP_7_YM]